MITSSGTSADDLFIVETHDPLIGPEDVLIRVSHFGLNRPDIWQRRGLYAPPPDASPLLGLEVSGTIAQLGENVQQWRIGDEVCALTHGGGYAQKVCVHHGHVLPRPKGWSLAQAASIPEAAITVYANLIAIGHVSRGESVLVHAANSGIGAMTIQMAKAFGAKVMATARGQIKCDFGRALGADDVFDSLSEDWLAGVKAQGGCDCVLDLLGGDFTDKNLMALKSGGRILQVGFEAGPHAKIDLRRLMAKRCVLTGSLLRPRSQNEKTALTKGLLRDIWPYFETGKIVPTISATYPMGEIVTAHKDFEASHHLGKIIIDAA